jgi:hypothetical protein
MYITINENTKEVRNHSNIESVKATLLISYDLKIYEKHPRKGEKGMFNLKEVKQSEIMTLN